MKDKIIDYIRNNRVSTTEVADCLNKDPLCLVSNTYPINRGHFIVGNIFWGYAYADSNWMIHEQVQNVQEGDVVIIEVFGCQDRAVFGDLVAKYLLLYKQARAIVVRGLLRDAPRLIKENWPIWCTGLTPIGCFNTKPDQEIDSQIIEHYQNKYESSIAVCDDSGVVVIPSTLLNEDFMNRLVFIEQQEDIWYDCIDRQKWSTFDTICLKKYLTNDNQ